jgi:hypothetical protein
LLFVCDVSEYGARGIGGSGGTEVLVEALPPLCLGDPSRQCLQIVAPNQRKTTVLSVE